VPELLAAGVNVALGTDSLASADSLDVLDDARALRREFPSLPAASVVRAATLGGARALGLAELGAIAPGRRAALAFAPAAGTLADPEEHVLAAATRLTRVA
jgi:cytosine/adenosine deaminase-related metal-dependent hydrolase